METNACPLPRFMRDIARHELIVHRDDGVYRHITGKRPGTICMHFHIVTFPGYLVYTGDMGSYTFCRLNDMFTFFRQRPGQFGRISPSYWAEKLEATSCNGQYVESGAKEWSDDKFKAVITERFNNHFARTDPDEDEPDEDEPEEKRAAFEEMKAEAWRQVVGEVFGWDDLEHEGCRAASDFSHEESGLKFEDLWEYDYTDWTMRFLWACYAITWAIAKYDQRPEVPASANWPCDSEGTPVEVSHG